MFIQSGKLNIIIDGQFGSTGKGLISAYIGWHEHVDLAITNSSPNAGHTYYYSSKRQVCRHLPISGILNRRSTIYLSAGSIIDPIILRQEILTFDIDPNRIYIHPRASVISPEDILSEQTGSVKSIASTMKGVGQALSRKIGRTAQLAQDHPYLKQFVRDLECNWLLDQDVCCLMEVPQGFDLSINSGLAYPYCTSREITVAQALSDAQIHPSYLGNVMACIRTYPIRVGNVIEDGKEVGYSGPFYPDSKEVTWSELGQDPEFTTNTKRMRRIATFSHIQYRRMIEALRPTHVFLNFANYMDPVQLQILVSQLPEVTHLGYGPMIEQVIEV